MFSAHAFAASPPLPSRAPRRRHRAGAGPRRFSALWAELRVQLMDARRGATFHPDETHAPPLRAYTGGGDA